MKIYPLSAAVVVNHLINLFSQSTDLLRTVLALSKWRRGWRGRRWGPDYASEYEDECYFRYGCESESECRRRGWEGREEREEVVIWKERRWFSLSFIPLRDMGKGEKGDRRVALTTTIGWRDCVDADSKHWWAGVSIKLDLDLSVTVTLTRECAQSRSRSLQLV